MINRSNIPPEAIVGPSLASNTLLAQSSAGECSQPQAREGAESTASHDQTAVRDVPKKDYATMLTFIEGSLVGDIGQNGSEDDPGNGEELGASATSTEDGTGNTRPNEYIPTLEEVARSGSKQLDMKQYIAYEIICCSFLLQLILEGGDGGTRIGNFLNATLNCPNTTLRDELIKKLKARGGEEQLIMLLSGAAGCGKSTSLQLAQQYCHKFCMAVAVAFNDITFYFTSTTGSSAALFGGMTIHSAAHLNKTRLCDALREEWKDVRILIIDEISFFKVEDIKKLDRQLRKLTGNGNKVYGGVSIVFSGDFHQLQPICDSDQVLYSGSSGALQWENTINSAIFLENSHRFKDDPEYGEILARMRMGTDTREDREKINTRVIGASSDNGVQLPTDPDACYACPTNKERNGITAGTFKKHILATHPTVDSDELPPDHTLMIEASIRRKRRKVAQAIHDTIVTLLGDDDIKSTEFSSKGAKIDPLLRMYPGSHHMCITNDDLKKGRGNGTLCRCVEVKLKDITRRQWKNWDGRKVWTVSADDVEWVKFEHWPEPPKNVPRYFILRPQTFSTTVNFPIGGGDSDITLRVGNVRVTQIPVNSNIATTGHKLQGMSKNTLIVNSWNYRFANWIYVVLSRVRTLAGLFLCKPLDLDKPFKVPKTLIEFERKMKVMEDNTLEKRAREMALN